jgi:ankyrin repeat protein
LRSFPGLVSVKETGGWGRTALHKAVGEGNIEMVKLLLANNADVNVQDTLHQFTPLHSAVSRSVAELLIANGANVHARTDKVSGSATPLHNAAQEGQLEVAETLIAHGADVNAKNEWGSTPLHCAVMEKKKDVVRLLLASKADTNSRDEWGRTVFDIAQKNDDSELIEMLRRKSYEHFCKVVWHQGQKCHDWGGHISA